MRIADRRSRRASALRTTAAFIVLLTAGTIAGAVLARGQAPDAATLKAIVGKEKKPHEQTTIVRPPLSKAESDVMIGKIQALRRILLDTPALKTLTGHDWATFSIVNNRENEQQPGRPLRLRLGYIAYPYFFNARQNRAESSAEGAPFSIYLNDPDAVLGEGMYRVDQDAKFTFPPADAGTVDGLPSYIVGEQFVVIMKEPRPLYVAVTQQQLLDLRIAQQRKSLADLNASLAEVPDSPNKQMALSKQEDRVSALEGELAAMSPAQRASPALDPDGARTSRPSSLAEPGATKTRAIVMPNPNLFDPKKPRTSVQLIVLGSTRYQPALFSLVQRQIDKAALLKLLD